MLFKLLNMARSKSVSLAIIAALPGLMLTKGQRSSGRRKSHLMFHLMI